MGQLSETPLEVDYCLEEAAVIFQRFGTLFQGKPLSGTLFQGGSLSLELHFEACYSILKVQTKSRLYLKSRRSRPQYFKGLDKA
ncbi:hypothetical protein RclHR1_07820002 [Rhizophagus clarus]|uniref:Uncharacterized protein n=1 Tax=Rhizophagus clarus TaxID=94130 RepID=A0A2Z6SLU5_9GLOM|nr:hypothetical protein RclHR1_07820002 [Rhizophagus clarus]